MRPKGLISQWKRFSHPSMTAATSGPPIPLKTDACVIVFWFIFYFTLLVSSSKSPSLSGSEFVGSVLLAAFAEVAPRAFA